MCRGNGPVTPTPTHHLYAQTHLAGKTLLVGDFEARAAPPTRAAVTHNGRLAVTRLRREAAANCTPSPSAPNKDHNVCTASAQCPHRVHPTQSPDRPADGDGRRLSLATLWRTAEHGLNHVGKLIAQT